VTLAERVRMAVTLAELAKTRANSCSGLLFRCRALTRSQLGGCAAVSRGGRTVRTPVVVAAGLPSVVGAYLPIGDPDPCAYDPLGFAVTG
jgi:hypothetical protein